MSFDNLSGIKSKKLNLGLLILFTFLALVTSFLIPGFGLIGAALLPVPAMLLVLAGRLRDGIICAAVSCLVILALNYILAPVVIALIVSIAFIHRWAIINDKIYWKVIAAVFFSFFGAMILYILLYSAFYRVNFFTESLTNYNGYIDNLADDSFIEAYSRLMLVDSSQMNEIVSQVQGMLRFIPRVLPGIFIVSFGIISCVNYVFSTHILKRYNVEIKQMPPFIKWDLPWYHVWGVILGLVLILIPNMSGPDSSNPGTFDNIIDIAGYNLTIIFGVLYLILGISVLFGIFARFKIGTLWKIFIFAFLWFFFGSAFIVFPLLGLIDIWVNFRKLKRK